jgi:hypothetical protein
LGKGIVVKGIWGEGGWRKDEGKAVRKRGKGEKEREVVNGWELWRGGTEGKGGKEKQNQIQGGDGRESSLRDGWKGTGGKESFAHYSWPVR